MIKNYKKLFLSFGAAAVLSSAAAFSSLAASGGWVSENGVWKYQEASGNYAYNTWKTSGDNSYYLDNNGVIAVNQWIDDTYYVDGDGVMAKNSWIQLSEDTSQKKAGWYYVDAKGKLIKDKWSTIGDKKYAFDSDGKMRTGWFFDNDDIYYLGDNGYAKTGWLCLDYDEDNKPDDERSLKSVLLLPILPNGFISRQTERQNVLRMTPIPLKPSGIINIILMKTV